MYPAESYAKGIDLDQAVERKSELEWFNTNAKNNLLGIPKLFDALYKVDHKLNLSKYRELFYTYLDNPIPLEENFIYNKRDFYKTQENSQFIEYAISYFYDYDKFDRPKHIFQFSGSLSGIIYYIEELLRVFCYRHTVYSKLSSKEFDDWLKAILQNPFYTQIIKTEVSILEWIYYYTIFSIEHFVKTRRDAFGAYFQRVFRIRDDEMKKLTFLDE
jgi:hypothetical protein